jgi:hypothetical protein
MVSTLARDAIAQTALTNDDEMFTEREFCGWQKISPNTARQWRTLGRGPAWIKVGRSVRYRRSDVEDWLARRTRTPVAS